MTGLGSQEAALFFLIGADGVLLFRRARAILVFTPVFYEHRTDRVAASRSVAQTRYCNLPELVL